MGLKLVPWSSWSDMSCHRDGGPPQALFGLSHAMMSGHGGGCAQCGCGATADGHGQTSSVPCGIMWKAAGSSLARGRLVDGRLVHGRLVYGRLVH